MWRVRAASAADVHAIEGLIVSAGGDAEDLAEGQFVVAKADDGIVLGCGRLRPYPEFCELASLAVAEKARDAGVVREIVGGLLDRFQGPVYPICEDLVVAFFRRFGFRMIQQSDTPPGLLPKWRRFTGHVGPMNVMRRE